MLKLKEHKEIILLVTVFIAFNTLFLHFYKDIWWDSSVYIGMGKFIYSHGNSGLWEPSRPLIVPLILGLGWRMGIDAVIFGKFIAIVFSCLTLLATYFIGKKLSSKNVSILAALFLAFSFTFFFFSSMTLSDIPATFFILLSLYMIFKKKYLLAGIWAGVAMMTRFFSVFGLIGIFLTLSYDSLKHNRPGNLAKLAIGILIIILPYFILNIAMYGNPIYPLELQNHLTKTTGWTEFRSFGFYISGLIKENYLLLLLLLIPFFLTKTKEFAITLLTPLAYLAIFTLVSHKEMRFMILILPFLYLLLSHLIFAIYNKSKIYHKKIALTLLIAVFIFSSTFSAVKAAKYHSSNDDQSMAYFQNFIKSSNGNIWITNPIFALYSNSRIDGLLYYFSSQKLIDFLNDATPPKYIFYNSCDMQCPPSYMDEICLESRRRLNDFTSKLDTIYTKSEGNCEFRIFSAIS